MEQEKSKKNNNKKIFWIVFYTVLAVLLCYVFVVIYFYYISPNNIALKLKLWPFQSDAAIGEMYSDATVQIDFQAVNPQTEETEKQTVVGVNVRSNGVIVTLYDNLRYYDGSDMTISTSKGVYSGKLLYGDINYNLAVVKCENKQGKKGAISIPYVNISNTSNMEYNQDIFTVSSPNETESVRQGNILGQSKYVWTKSITYSGAVGLDYALKDCFVFNFSGKYKADFNTYTGGGVLDKDGNLLGFYVGYSLDEGGFVCTPACYANKFLDKALNTYNKSLTYKNELLASMQTVDLYDITIHLYYSSISDGNNTNPTAFYYGEEPRGWKGYTDELRKFEENKMDCVFLFEDLQYKDDKILDKASVITKIKINGKTYTIENKLDLLNAVYAAREGQKIQIFYNTVYDTTTELQTEEFTF